MTGTWKYDKKHKRWYFYSDEHVAYRYPKPTSEAVLGSNARVAYEVVESLYMYNDEGALLQLFEYNGGSVMCRRVHGTTMSEQEEQAAIEFGNSAGLFELSDSGVFEVAMGG